MTQPRDMQAPEPMPVSPLADVAVTVTSGKARRVVPNVVEFARDILALSLSPAQEALLRATDALPLVGDHRDLYRQCSGNTHPPRHPYAGVTVGAGARSGKDSRFLVPKVLHEALFGGHEKHLGRGEFAVIPVVMPTKLLTMVTYGYVRAHVLEHPMLRGLLIAEPTADTLRFNNRVVIQCFPCTGAALRAWSIPVGVENEVAFYRLEGNANSDVEIRASIRRGMLSFPHPREFCCSTPYWRSGILFEDFRAAFGQDNPDRLYWKASSVLMNPSLASARLEQERRLDPLRFAREYEAEWIADLAAFLPPEWIESARERGCHERPPQPGVRYVFAVDTAGGGEHQDADVFTCAVVHAEGLGAEARIVQDVMRGRRSADLAGTVREHKVLADAYGCHEVHGDKYAAGWVRQAYAEAGLRYINSTRTRSECYLDIEPLLAQGRLILLDHAALVQELKNLERRPQVGGRTVVDHPQLAGHHDDHANSLALAAAVVLAAMRQPTSCERDYDIG